MKRYRIYASGRKFDYTYDAAAGVWRVRVPGTRDFTTGQAPTPEAARDDVRKLIEEATGETLRRSPERTQFLRGILCTLAEGGLGYGCGHYVDRTLTGPINDGGEYTSVTVWYPDADDAGQQEHVINEDRIASALAKVNDALTDDQLKTLDISGGWRKRMTQANRLNDAGLVDAIDAANLAEIAVFGQVRFYG